MGIGFVFLERALTRCSAVGGGWSAFGVARGGGGLEQVMACSCFGGAGDHVFSFDSGIANIIDFPGVALRDLSRGSI